MKIKIIFYLLFVLFSAVNANQVKIASVKIDSILFDYGRSDLDSNSVAEMEKIGEFMKADRGNGLELTPYLDSIEIIEFKRTLAIARAKNVKDYLVKSGINTNRIKIVKYNQTFLYNNQTEENRALNRCVKFVFMK